MAAIKTPTAEAIREAVARVAKRPLEDVQPSSDLMGDLGIRYVSRVELAVITEDQFGVALTNEQVMRFKTVADVIAAVERG